MNRFGSVALTLAVLMVLMLAAAASTGAGGFDQVMNEREDCVTLCNAGCLYKSKDVDCQTLCSKNCPNGICSDEIFKSKKPKCHG
ncbi:hypothetical protein OROHE_026049 [Orobanche hederae]